MSLPLLEAILRNDQRGNPDMLLMNKRFRQSHVDAMTTLSKRVVKAKTYELGDDALILVDAILRMTFPEMLALFQNIALPADLVYVEYDADKFYKLAATGGAIIDVAANSRAGILISGTKDSQEAPIAFHFVNLPLHGFPIHGESWKEFRGSTPTNWPESSQRTLQKKLQIPETHAARIPRYDALSTVIRLWEDDLEVGQSARALADLCMSHLESHLEYIEEPTMGYTQGVMQIALAILTLIDRKPIWNGTQKEVAVKSRPRIGVTKNVGITYDTISLKASPKRTLSGMRKSIVTRKLTIQHEVGEHWVYRSRRTIDQQCNHFWTATGDRGKQMCVHCNALRWKRNGSVRGHASAGIKIATHTVIR